MFSYRKYQAILYHYINVLKKLIEYYDSNNIVKVEANVLNLNLESMGLEIKTTTITKFSSTEFVYELSSYLEAMKSAIDFLATACAIHLKGIELDSITTLIKSVKRGRVGLIFDQVKNYLSWLEYIRSYRHHLIHRNIFTLEIIKKHQCICHTTIIYTSPLIIPDTPPKFLLDTREVHSMDYPFNGIQPYIETSIIIDEKITEDYIEDSIPKGYILIEEFMKKNLITFMHFFIDIITCLLNSDFFNQNK